MSKVLVTGVNGQLGRYLLEVLREDPSVDLIIGTSLDGSAPIQSDKRVVIQPYDLRDWRTPETLIRIYKPTHFINLAAISSPIAEDFTSLVFTMNTSAVINQLEAISLYSKGTVYINAGSSLELTQDSSSYSDSKRAARVVIDSLRKQGVRAGQPYLFNSESPFRGEPFLTHKLRQHIQALRKGEGRVLEVGNINDKRDWSHAGDMACYLWDVTRNYDNFFERGNSPRLGSGETHSVADLLEEAFSLVKGGVVWDGEELFSTSGQKLTTVANWLKRNGVPEMNGRPTRTPKYSFKEMVYSILND